MPIPVIAKVPVPTDEVPMIKAPLLFKLTLLAPLLLSDTAPVNALLLPKVIALAPALKLEVPDTVIAADCAMAPALVMLKLLGPVRFIAPSVNVAAVLLLNVTVPLVVFVAVNALTVSAPLKLVPPTELVVRAGEFRTAVSASVAPEVSDIAVPVLIF
jgi:hypothetical protein